MCWQELIAEVTFPPFPQPIKAGGQFDALLADYSTNWAQRRVTSFMRQMTLPLCQMAVRSMRWLLGAEVGG